MVVLFLLGVTLLLYALRSTKIERVCVPQWASHPAGTHLSIAIVTFSNEALQNKKREKKEMVRPELKYMTASRFLAATCVATN